ncbi:16936_t:CDS:2, partial [Acaulospora colombiana]
MNLLDLFTRYRKTEPIEVLFLRAFVTITLIAALTGYITSLVIEIANDLPITKNSIDNEGQSLVPCSQYLNQPTLSNGTYYGSFSAKSELSFIFNSQNLTSVGFIASTVDPLPSGYTNLMTIIVIDSGNTNDQSMLVQQLRDRVNALETFLQEYVVDAEYLEGMAREEKKGA